MENRLDYEGNGKPENQNLISRLRRITGCPANLKQVIEPEDKNQTFFICKFLKCII